ncbi:MAG TPA: DUF58 domain-containing protein [Vicinamibacterales bacterium]|jgi:uncharacterized protein (DUF58 family)|nr:DUF58 domain-containing protein [Vicinamibacterales bacterium]
MMEAPAEAPPFVSLADISEIELIILKRMKDVTIGDHRSRQHGSGFDFLGLRDWQAGDRPSAIDWAQSSLKNFSPLVVREFEQPSTATVGVIADRSASTACGAGGVPIAAIIARAIATIGMSAVFFQDQFGLVTFDEGFRTLGTVRPRTGRGHVVHCLDAYQRGVMLHEATRTSELGVTLSGYFRSTSLLPVVSDFLFDKPEETLQQLSRLNAVHDVFLVMIDSAFAFALPPVSGGWIETMDVESGRTRVVSRAEYRRLADRVREWQDHVQALAKSVDLDIVRIGRDTTASDVALSEFVAERRLRKMFN